MKVEILILIVLGVQIVLLIMFGIFIFRTNRANRIGTKRENSNAQNTPEETQSAEKQKQPHSGDDSMRTELAQDVVRWSMGSFAVAALLILGCALAFALAKGGDATDHIDLAKYVFTTMLPVIGAWVGTILAFYFGHENFRQAAKNFQTTARVLTSGERLESLCVSDLGIPIESLRTFQSSNPEKIRLGKIFDYLKKHQRLPVLKWLLAEMSG